MQWSINTAIMAKLIFLVLAAVCIGVCAAAAVNDEFGYPQAGNFIIKIAS